MGENSNLIGYGLEGLTNPDPHELYAINNTLVNEKSAGSFFAVMNGADRFKAYNNILAGAAPSRRAGGRRPWTRWPTCSRASPACSSIHRAPTTTTSMPSSPAHATGFPAGVSNSGVDLVAYYEYVHPTDGTLRCQHATLDVGAYEVCTTQVDEPPTEVEGMHIFPNPATDYIQVRFTGIDLPATLVMLDAQSRVLRSWKVNGQRALTLEVGDLPVGMHLLQAVGGTTTGVHRVDHVLISSPDHREWASGCLGS